MISVSEVKTIGKELRINEQIRAREVRVVSDANEQLGIMTLHEAIHMAEEKGFDLVEVAPNGKPPNIEDHDFYVKLKNAQRFLAEGNKVKVTIMFRGREMTHPELGRSVLERVLHELGDAIIREKPPKLEGRNMTMVIAPKA